MHCFYLNDDALAFYVQKIGQRTFFNTFTHKPFLLSFKLNCILYSDDCQSCLESKGLLAEGINFFIKKIKIGTVQSKEILASEANGFNEKSVLFLDRNRNYFTNALERLTWNSLSLLAGRELASRLPLTSSLFSLTSCCQTSGSQVYLTPEEPRVQMGMLPDNPLLSSHTFYFSLKRKGQKGRPCEGCLVQTPLLLCCTQFNGFSNRSVAFGEFFLLLFIFVWNSHCFIQRAGTSIYAKNEIFMTGTVT